MHVDPGDMFWFAPWAYTNGGTLLNADWTKSTLASPQTIEAAAFAQSLCLKGYSPKPGGAFDDVTEFANDKLAIFGCGMWQNPGIVAAKATAKVKVVSWPVKTHMGTSVGWNAYPITKASTNKEAAWAFLKYVASKRAVINLTLTGQATPGRKSVFYGYLPKAAPEKGIGDMWTSVNYATPVPERLGRGRCRHHQVPDSAVLVQRRRGNAHEAVRRGGDRLPQEQLKSRPRPALVPASPSCSSP